MYFKESLQKIFGGNHNIIRQLSIFSICGIVGLIDVYVTMNGFANLNIYKKAGYVIMWLLFLMYFTGYETLFLHERELPEIDLRSFKIVFSKTLLAVFAFVFAIFILRLTLANNFWILLCDMLLAVPLVAVQAGYSYNFDEKDIFSVVKKITFKDFILLVLKRLYMLFLAYALVLFTVITGLVGLAIGILLASKGETAMLLYTLSSQQTVLAELVVYVAGIILSYVLINATLMWDYELIKTHENK